MWSSTIVIYPQLSYARSTKLFFSVGGILVGHFTLNRITVVSATYLLSLCFK
jgi:hypothetical protein